jgi:hypothetical protein
MNTAPHLPPCDPSTGQPVFAAREPLAVLLLGTDILKSHGDRLSRDLLADQWRAMRRAASQLTAALALETTD